jgi:hypothetical protein
MNPKNILNLLCKSFDQQYNIKTVIISEEINFASQLEGLIKDAIDDYTFMECYTTLNFEDESTISDPIIIEEDFEDDYEKTIKGNKKLKADIDFHYKQKDIEFWRSGQKKFETVKHRYKKIANRELLYKWEAQIVESGSRNKKLLEIFKYVLDKFQNALDKSVPIHDLDIKRWVLKARDDCNLSQHLFMASSK